MNVQYLRHLRKTNFHDIRHPPRTQSRHMRLHDWGWCTRTAPSLLQTLSLQEPPTGPAKRLPLLNRFLSVFFVGQPARDGKSPASEDREREWAASKRKSARGQQRILSPQLKQQCKYCPHYLDCHPCVSDFFLFHRNEGRRAACM